MTEQQPAAPLTLQQKNEVVARYAGGELIRNPFLTGTIGMQWLLPKSDYNPRNAYWWNNDLQFHSNWQWQIPVWAKCKSDWFQTLLHKGDEKGFRRNKLLFWKAIEAYQSSVNTNNPSAAFDVLVEAITHLTKLKEG